MPGVAPAALKAAAVILEEYLSLARQPKKETLISLNAVPEGGKNYRIVALMGDQRFEAPLVFPETLNDALVGLTETLSKALGKPLAAKKILPFLNQTASESALLRYADGVTAMDNSDWKTAAAAFEDALHSDYNYVEAYAGLGAAQAALGQKNKAKAALQKAKLLNPYRAKTYEDLANRYLKEGCGGNG